VTSSFLRVSQVVDSDAVSLGSDIDNESSCSLIYDSILQTLGHVVAFAGVAVEERGRSMLHFLKQQKTVISEHKIVFI